MRAAAAALAFVFLATVPAVAADTGPEYRLAGLHRPVDLLIDKWGVPHIYAADSSDLFFAQGFTVARDRLFQIDTWRRRGLGQLSEVLGQSYVDQDRAARLFLYRGDMDAEWAAYGPEGRLAATQFAEGINAYVDWLARNPSALPPEFAQLGYRPAHWAPQDVVRIRTHAIGENLSWEVTRAKLVCLAGPGASRFLRSLHPTHEAVVPPGLDPCSIPDDVLKVYNLATAAVSFTGSDFQTKDIADATSGSNSWAIGGERTASGRPILANDPHRGADALPSGRYVAQLSAPGLDLAGAGEPWNPGIAIGHNENIAFGLTNLPIDQTDLYVYELDPNDHTRYRYGNDWERMTTVTEAIPVRGGAPAVRQLSFTRHGPVVKVDEAAHRAFAVRTAWTEPGSAAYLASLNYQRADNFREFTAGMRAWGTPGSNLVYADVHGNIGYVPAGLTPRRTGTGYDGLLPVPGDGRYEWNGFHANSELPGQYNPSSGFFASANDFNIPPGYPVVSNYEWQLPYRKQRIDELITSRPGATVADSLSLQKDEKSLVATGLLEFVRGLSSTDPDTAKALDLLRGYDGVTSVDSAAAALFETWIMKYLHYAWAHAVLPQAAADVLARTINPDFSLIISSFADPSSWLGPDGAAVRDKLILDTLPLAFRDVAGKLGTDPSAWRWGALHYQEFVHPLGGPNVGPTPVGGSYHTVHPSFYHPLTYQQIIGATFKMALDVGNWDGSYTINAPGQSGDPRSPHYRDLYELWASGGTFPLLYSRPEVERNLDVRIRLVPSGLDNS
ncbi:penicillin acylase family protein [Amycolatopsis cynarae]|uniref:Penicillin acylase family protein n=1 Tax=Amycolatopsis cynarae TaxID=2995223 RepID=A0ABY7B8Y8_9PSEU|nr:penicillin acylase family protein [Amycolatopsis sp. HUAS 11-8]WAL68616.1 penicillin acylase family protein [Amycolatopsis sp. HUAS 11-8]